MLDPNITLEQHIVDAAIERHHAQAALERCAQSIAPAWTMRMRQRAVNIADRKIAAATALLVGFHPRGTPGDAFSGCPPTAKP